jgi:hypothetical protein
MHHFGGAATSATIHDGGVGVDGRMSRSHYASIVLTEGVESMSKKKDSEEALTRIAIVEPNKCKPKKCRQVAPTSPTLLIWRCLLYARQQLGWNRNVRRTVQ